MRNALDVFGSYIFKRGKKYEDFYNVLVTKKKIFANMQQLFFLAASIGFKKRMKESFEAGQDIRADHLSPDSLDLFYTMYLNDNHTVEDLNDQNELRRYLKNDLVEYSEGGLKYLSEEVFSSTWNKNALTLREDYDDYLEDIMAFIKSENNEDIF